MFERTKISLLFAIILAAVGSWVIGDFHDPRQGVAVGTLAHQYSYYYDIVIMIGIAIVMAVSLNLVNGHTGQFSLGHAGFMGLGAYFSSMVALNLQFPLVSYPSFEGSWYFGVLKGLGWVLALALNGVINFLNTLVSAAHALPGPVQFIGALLVGGIAAGVAGFIVGIPSLRLKGDYLAIVTLGFNEIIRVVVQNSREVGGATGLTNIPQSTNFFSVFACAAVAVYVVGNLVNSTYGRGFLAVRDDEVAAEAMGINTTKYKVVAFVAAAFFAGVGGGLWAHFKQVISPDGFTFMKSFDFVVMVILGGMGNTVGVILAAILLTVLPELLRLFSQSDALVKTTKVFTENEETIKRVQDLFSNRMIFFSLILIVVMLLRPQGLFTRSPGKLAKS